MQIIIETNDDCITLDMSETKDKIVEKAGKNFYAPLSEWPSMEEYEVEYDDEMEEAVFKSWLSDDKTLEEIYDMTTNYLLLDDTDKEKVYAFVKYGYDLEEVIGKVNELEVYSFSGCSSDSETLTKLAELFIDEGLFGNVHPNLKYYINYELLGRDLGYDYSVVEPGLVIYPSL